MGQYEFVIKFNYNLKLIIETSMKDTDSFNSYLLGSGCSTAVERMPHNREVVGRGSLKEVQHC